MRFRPNEIIAVGLVALMMLAPLAAAVMKADDPVLQQKARTDLIQEDPAKAPAGAPAPAAPQN